MEVQRKSVDDQRVERNSRLGIWIFASAAVLGSLLSGAAFLIREGIVEAERLRNRDHVVDTPQLTSKPDVQVLFQRPEEMQIRWEETRGGNFCSTPLTVPGRRGFSQGAIHRLKLTGIDGHVGLALYPTIEISETTPRTEAYFAHNAIPILFTAEDFDQVMAGNFVTKVTYMPNCEFEQLTLSGLETISSTRLDRGVDPVEEAGRRGAIVAVIRLGNRDVEKDEQETQKTASSPGKTGISNQN